MILRQYYLGCLSHASYLVGDEEAGIAAVVDPQRDVEGYVEDARALGVSIRHVVLTHLHADFVAGHLELRDRCGATIHLGEGADVEYANMPARDGGELLLGRVRLRFLATPGHTPEGVCVLVFDDAVDAARPHAVLTGDTLFIGDVGRPDLLVSTGRTAEEMAGLLFDSLREKLLPLPDETLVYPAHGAGSACGKNMSSETVSTMGQQRLVNHALQPMTRESFVALVTRDQPESPRYFAFDADLNRRERETLDETMPSALRPLALDDVGRLASQSCHVLDTRDADRFAEGHLRGSLNIGLSGKYATWAGSLLQGTHPIVVVAEPGRERESAMRLGRIGFDQVAGYLEGGMAATAGRPDLVESWTRAQPADLAARLAQPDPPVVLDVRADGERAQASIDGSLHVPLPHLEERMSEVPADRDVVIVCGSGFRSSIAASLLARGGRRRVTDLVGGVAAWQAAGLPTRGEGVVSGQSCRIDTTKGAGR